MLSFIVRTYNEERWVGHCIQSIMDNVSGKYEIVVVDNESTDDTVKIVKMFNNKNLKIVTIPRKEYTPGKALNLGLSSTSKKSKAGCLISAHCTVSNINGRLLP